MSEVPTFPWTRVGDQMTVLTGTVRLSFPHLAEARGFEGQAPKFSASLIFPKSADLAALKGVIQTALAEKFGNRMPPNVRTPLRDGAEKIIVKDDGSQEYQKAYGPDVFFMNVTAKNRPKLVDNLNKEITDKAQIESVFYPGCYVRCILRAFAYDVQGNKGASLGLNAVQFVGHGEQLGMSVNPADVFTPVQVDSGGLAGGDDVPFDGGQPRQPVGGGSAADFLMS